MTRRWATIKDVARLADVSVATASNVFNSTGRFSEATRARVIRAADELHYAPNALIRSLQSGKTNTIGVFTWRVGSAVTHSITLHVLEGITDVLGQAGLDLLLYSRHPHEGFVPNEYFLDGRIDGLILAPGGLPDGGLDKLAESGLPIVTIYQPDAPLTVGSVTIDNVGGVRSGVEHLFEMGHRRIAYMSPLYTADYRERLTGYRNGLSHVGLNPEPAVEVLCDGYHEYIMDDLTDRLLSGTCDATAVITGDDSVAIPLLKLLRRRGLRVPRDLSVMGFDDTPASEASPGLSTLRQPAQQVGRTAGEFVQRMIDGHPASECRAVLPVELVVRGTTAPPGASASAG